MRRIKTVLSVTWLVVRGPSFEDPHFHPSSFEEPRNGTCARPYSAALSLVEEEAPSLGVESAQHVCLFVGHQLHGEGNAGDDLAVLNRDLFKTERVQKFVLLGRRFASGGRVKLHSTVHGDLDL